MTTISEEKFNVLVDEIIKWKTSPESNMTWEKLQSRLFFIDYLGDLREDDPDSYDYYAPLLIQEAKTRIEKASELKGLAPKHENWFFTDNMKDGRYWHRFEKLMKFEGWDDNRWKVCESQTLDIVNCLSDPAKTVKSDESRFKKGLVYGNVQSGKTAHIASVISMYASAGCKMFIVLSGVTNSLREQTQDRLRHDLGIDTTGGYDLLTTENDLIGKKQQQIQGKYQNDNCVIGVFKKNPAALRKLTAYLQNINDPSFWIGKQVLIIDDECDQYSVNVRDMSKTTAIDEETGEEFTRSTINKLIVKLFKVFDKYAYVGYTATPFANILNEPPSENSIYPSDFIYPLAMSDKYYGARKIFGSYDEDPDNPAPVLDVINPVDKKILDPKKANYHIIPDSLKTAVLYFVVGTAVKYKREIRKHSSLLINVDSRIATHDAVDDGVKDFVKLLKENLESYHDEMVNIWDLEKNRNDFEVIKQLFKYSDEDKEKYIIPEIDDIWEEIKEVTEKLEIKLDNSSVAKEDRLKYHEDKADVYIVIGGNTLSRGLTIEGLLVSYFYRTSAFYDTLLQMGRWFGYRMYYEDLPRIWTTLEIMENFSKLADVEDEMRGEFSQYGFGVTPNDISPRIRTYPGLEITKKLGMQSARANLINFCGYRPQTLFFPKDDSVWLNHNIKATRKFLNSIGKTPAIKNNAYQFENIGIDAVRNYIFDMNIDDRNSSFEKDPVLHFLDKAKQKDFLLKWNVVVMTNRKGTEFDLSDNLKVNLLERSRMDLKATRDDEIYLKSITSPEEILIDTGDFGKPHDDTSVPARFIIRNQYFEKKDQKTPGLLIIYPINKDSQPSVKGRLPMDSAAHVIGLTLIFPKENNKDLNQYMSIEL